MLRKNLYPALALSITTAMLTACGGGGDDDDKTDDVNETRVQIYNASSDSPTLSFEFEDNDDDTTDFLYIDFGDASAMTTMTKNGDYDVTIEGIDSDGEYEDILETEVTLKNNKRNLVFVTGDYPDLALTTFYFDTDDLYEDTFRLVVADFVTDSPGYDIYASESSDDFEDATLWASTDPGTAFEVADYDVDTFDVYLTETGSDEILFTAEDVAMESDTGYVLILRDSFGPSDVDIALDKMTSSTTVISYEDAYGDAQYRIMNLLDETINAELLAGSDSYTTEDVASLSTSDYEIVEYGDYQITITDEDGEILNEAILISLPQNDTRAAAVYKDEEGTVKVLTFEESVRDMTYESDVYFTNLTTDIDQVDVYFVETSSNETVDSTDYTFQSVDFEEVESGELPSETYRVYVVVETEDETLQTIFISDEVEFDDDYNYTLMLYNDDDNDFGYNILFSESEADDDDDDDDDE